THSWQPAKTAEGTPGNPSSPLAVTGSPEESFSFTLAMDSSDTIVTGGAGETLARTSGVYARLAALERLLFPVSPAGLSLVGTAAQAYSDQLRQRLADAAKRDLAVEAVIGLLPL